MRQSFALKHLLIATVMVAALLPHGVGAARYDQAPSDGARRERLF